MTSTNGVPSEGPKTISTLPGPDHDYKITLKDKVIASE